ncbi:DUF5707 domain-containing protein [Streptomyces atroolivaceus]|uniref:DUF5707 domain-containing protein n=1 Tax=Streptomyces atroolivaceus TaxID=66869 RepID=A0ABV9V3Z7_STRAZ
MHVQACPSPVPPRRRRHRRGYHRGPRHGLDRHGTDCEEGVGPNVAPEGSRAGSLTFTAEVHDDSGVRGLKVLVRQHRARSGQGGDARRHAPRAAALPAAPLAVSAR